MSNFLLSKQKNISASGTGSHHWWLQRLTSIIMTIALPWVIYIMHKLSMLEELSAVIEAMRSPSYITPIMIFFITAFYHGSLGMQVIIEDYISNICIRNTIVVTIQVFSLITIISGMIALLSLMVF